jgi:hypothetical protein
MYFQQNKFKLAMVTHLEQALTSFRSGLNCAQSVVSAYSEQFNGDLDLALGISCGFGGGMGRSQMMKDNHLYESVCEKCISDSINIINELVA